MAEGSVDDIFVEIQVRLDKLEAGLRNAEQVIDSSTRRMDSATKRVGEGFGSISPNVQKAVIAIAALHIAMRVTESLADLGGSAFQLMTADIEDSRQAAENLVNTIEKIPQIGPAFRAGRQIGEFFLDARKLFEQDFDSIIADVDRFLTDLDKGSTRHDEREKRIGVATQLFGIISPQSKAAERELQILEAITKEERIRLKFVFEREDLERKIGELNKQAQRASRSGEISPLEKILGGKIGEFEQTILELIDAREREALRKKERAFRDPTTSFITATGTAIFGGGNQNLRFVDPPTKQAQDKQASLITKTNQRLSMLISTVDQIGFA